MTALFIDTTYDVSLGLLDESCKWVDLRSFKGQKSSTILQPESLNLLNDFKIKPESLSAVISIAGPGFYTGLRLSEGFCDVFRFFNIPHYSFYSYDIPLFCGDAEGTWLTKAYRGEYFFHSWKDGILKNEMIPTKELDERLVGLTKLFIHSESSLDETTIKKLNLPIATSDILRSNPEIIFPKVINEKMTKESFYFRPPEDEFKANP